MGFLSFLFGSCSKQSTEGSASENLESKFREGQIWAIKPPENQPNARLVILRVEDGGKLGTIVHIALTGVLYGDGHTSVQHLPFAESAIEESVITLERESGPVPDFAEGYRLWREAFDSGKGGVFTGTVADTFDAITGVLKKPR